MCVFFLFVFRIQDHRVFAENQNSPDFSKLMALSSTVTKKLNDFKSSIDKLGSQTWQNLGIVRISIEIVVKAATLYPKAIKESYEKNIKNPGKAKIRKMWNKMATKEDVSLEGIVKAIEPEIEKTNREIDAALERLSELDEKADKIKADVEELKARQALVIVSSSSAAQQAVVKRNLADIQVIMKYFMNFSTFVSAFVVMIASWLAPLLKTMNTIKSSKY